MISVASAEFIAELEGAVEGGSPARRAQMLRQVTQLLLSSANRLDERQIGVFDDVLIRLIERVEARMLAQLSTTLSDLTSAPKQAVRRLACHEDATVAGPILLKSETLSESDLIEDAIEPLMEESDCCGLVVACRASRLNWQTTLAVINSRGHTPLSQQELEQGKELFESLSLSVAQRTIRFGSVREFGKSGSTDNEFAAARVS